MPQKNGILKKDYFWTAKCMKKVFTTIFALIYLATSMGATVHFHYCMGKLVSWGLTDRHGNDCRFCGMPKKITTDQWISGQKGCCADQHQHVQTAQDQKMTAAANEWTRTAVAVLVPGYGLQATSAVSSLAITDPLIHAPPDDPSVPAYLLNRNFRI
jgi:hypothetical protein